MLVLFLTSTFICLSAQEEQSDKLYEPQFGEPGKDARWEPTPQIVVEKMLDLAKVTSGDFVIDLGSGDGRIVITAAKRGAKARGIEYNQDMVELSRRLAASERVSELAEFMQGDLFETDLSQATVITMYLLTRNNLKLRPALLELKPGTRIVSNSHTMDNWIPDASEVDIKDGDSYWNIYFWIVPAKVEGTWKIPKGELKLSQKFQMVSGTLKTGKNTTDISEGRLNGDEITFSANGEIYSGRVNGNSIEGTITSAQKTRKWNASLKRLN
jgi:precorrin-6B methylase 2